MSTESNLGPVQYDVTQPINRFTVVFEPNQNTVVRSEAPLLLDPAEVVTDPEAAQDLQVELYRSASTAGRIGVQHAILNEAVDSGEITVIAQSWGGKFSGAVSQRELLHTARANQSTRFLVFDHLGGGGSDPMPRALSRKMLETGRMDDYAAIIQDGIGSAIADYDKVNFMGRSMGGLVAMEMAFHQSRPIGTMLVHDAPGSRAMNRREILRNFVGSEGAHAAKYVAEATLDPATIEAQADLNSLSQLARSVLTDVAKARFKRQYTQSGRSMFRGQLGTTITEALPYVQDGFVFLSPHASELNNPFDVQKDIAKAVNDAKQVPANVEQVWFNGTHAFGQGTPAVVSRLEKDALDQLANR